MFILDFAFLIIYSNTYQFSFAKSDIENSSSSTKDKTKSDTENSDKSNTKTVNTTDEKKQFEQFGKCLSVIADNKDFATEKEIKDCVMVVYDSDSSISSTTSSRSSLFNEGDK